MAVKWIGAVAKELGMDAFDAVELLASKPNYPMNGLLDEDRVQFLKLYRGERRGAEAASQAPREAAEPADGAIGNENVEAPEETPEKKTGGGAEEPLEKVTTLTLSLQDRAEDKT